MTGDCQDCTGILYSLWILGYYIYLGWMGCCMYFVFLGSFFQMLVLQDWTSTIPLGFMAC